MINMLVMSCPLCEKGDMNLKCTEGERTLWCWIWIVSCIFKQIQLGFQALLLPWKGLQNIDTPVAMNTSRTKFLVSNTIPHYQEPALLKEMADPESLADNVSFTWRGRDWYHMPPNMMNKNKKDTASPLQCSCQKCRTRSHHEERDKPKMWDILQKQVLWLYFYFLITAIKKKKKKAGREYSRLEKFKETKQWNAMHEPW